MANIIVNGRTMAYQSRPVDFDRSQTTLVFISGSGGDSSDWQNQLDGLAGITTSIAIDLPGHGNSDLPWESSVSAYAERVSEFIEGLGLEKVMLIGCSLGSAIALHLAVESKPWLVALGLVGSGGRLRVHPDFLAGFKKDVKRACGLITDFALSPAASDDVRSTVKEKFLKTPEGLVHADLSACNDFDVLESLHTISIPTWIIVGQDDRLTPVKYSKFLEEAIPNAHLVIVPDAGHLVMIEKPEEFNTRLTEFLSRLNP